MTAKDDFLAALHSAATDDPYGLPGVVADAAARAIGADGASLNIRVSGLRIPLGASDDAARRAESLQFTEGSGPCVDAALDASIVTASATELEERWPALTRRWRAETPFRSVVSAPVPLAGIQSAIDFYFGVDDGDAEVDRATLAVVTQLVADQFDEDLYAAPDSPLATDRAQVWAAIGMLVGATTLDAREALESLRAWSTARDLVLDDVARQVVADEIALDDIVA